MKYLSLLHALSTYTFFESSYSRFASSTEEYSSQAILQTMTMESERSRENAAQTYTHTFHARSIDTLAASCKLLTAHTSHFDLFTSIALTPYPDVRDYARTLYWLLSHMASPTAACGFDLVHSLEMFLGSLEFCRVHSQAYYPTDGWKLAMISIATFVDLRDGGLTICSGAEPTTWGWSALVSPSKLGTGRCESLPTHWTLTLRTFASARMAAQSWKDTCHGLLSSSS